MKKILLTILQVSVTGFVLYLVFHDPVRRQQMAEALGRADKWWIALGVVVGSLTYLAGTIRFGVLLRTQGIFLPWLRVAGIFMVGLFFNLFGLGSTGGDVVKIFYVLREAGDKKTAAAFTVLMDRVVGLVALVLIAVGFVMFRYRWLTQTPAAAALVTAFAVVMAAAMAVLVAAAFLAATGLVERLPAGLPGRAKIVELVAVFRTSGATGGASWSRSCFHSWRTAPCFSRFTRRAGRCTPGFFHARPRDHHADREHHYFAPHQRLRRGRAREAV